MICTRRGYVLRVEVARGVERVPGRTHHAVGVEGGILLGGAEESLHRLERHPDIRDLFVDVLEFLDTDRVHQHRGKAQQEFGLGDILHHHLMRHVDDGAGSRVSAVAAVHISVEEDALPGDEHVVEDHHRILLFKARAERMVVDVAVVVHRFAAEELQPLGGAGNGKAEGIGRILGIRGEQRRGENEDFVGHGQRRQHARAANHNAVVALLFDARAEEGVGLAGNACAAVGLRVDQRVRQAEVVLAHIFVVATRVLAEARVLLRKKVRAAGIGGNGAVQIVRRTAHHAHAVIGPAFHHAADAFQLVLACAGS